MKLHNVDGVDIPFEKHWENIAISVSGGADSALLAYLICSLISNDTTVHIISHTRMWKLVRGNNRIVYMYTTG